MKYEDYIANRDHAPKRAEQQVKPVQPELTPQEKMEPVPQPKAVPSVTVYDQAPEQPAFAAMQKNLYDCLTLVDNEVMKEYLPVLQGREVVPVDEVELSQLDQIQFFRINELVYQENEFSVDKLATVFNTLSNKPCTLVLMIRSNEQTNNFYLGVRSRDGKRYSTGTMRGVLEQSLLGLFPGSLTGDYYSEQLSADLSELEHSGCVSSVTCVADYKQESEGQANKNFIQGLEKFVDSMQGRSFTVICIANNLSHQDLVQTRQGYEQIYTELSPFANMQYNYAVNKSSSQSKSGTITSGQSQTRGTSKGMSVSQSTSEAQTRGTNRSTTHTDTQGTSLSEGDTTSHTVGTSDSTSESDSITKTRGRYAGLSLGSNVGINAGLSFIASIGASVGLSSGVNAGVSSSVARGHTHGTSHTDSVSDSTSHSVTRGTSRSASLGQTEGNSQSQTHTGTLGSSMQYSENRSLAVSASTALTAGLSDTFGSSQTVTLNIQNKTLLNTLDRLEQQMKRLDECESIGMWDFAAYFLGETAAEAETAASMYRSLVSGSQSGVQLSAINTWTSAETVRPISRYVTHFLHPAFFYVTKGDSQPLQTIVDATTLVSTNELALQLGLPRRSVKGLPVIEHAPFAQEVLNPHTLAREKDHAEQMIQIGQISYFGHLTGTPVALDLQSLSMHTFVTGSTGAGKSNTIYKILEELIQKQVKFLVVEPAKGEYKQVFGSWPDVTVLGTNPALGPLLQIDPFSFPPEIHIYEHLDRLVELFNVCWPMYAAMPAVLKNAVEKSYVDCGWDLVRSTNKYGEALYPSFADVARNIKEIIDTSEYDSDNKGAYKGSLLTRLQSLTNGINGMIFTCDEIAGADLFDKNVIIDLSRVGSSETKSLIMGMLVLKLQEYRMATATDMNERLKHITVLEEAHNLLRRTSTEQASESANLQGKSVEMLANAIAEMRTYGEGFVIADQAPGLLDLSVIRNTNTKIIMRLPDRADRELVGRAANLNDDQIIELAKLPCGVAAIYQNEWIQPVLCQIDRYSPETESFPLAHNTPQKEFTIDNTGYLKTQLFQKLMNEDVLDCHKNSSVCELRDLIENSRLGTRIKVSYLQYLELDPADSRRKYALARLLYELLDVKSVFADIPYNDNIKDWIHYALQLMPENWGMFSLEQQARAMLLVLFEHKKRGPAEKQLFLDFVEFLQEGGEIV